MRVLVTGGRDYQNRDRVFSELSSIDEVLPISLVVHGACCYPDRPTELRGADRWAQEWAQWNEVPYIGIPAQWGRFGKSAGPRRNAYMAKLPPQLVIAFPGGAGTANMIDEARLQGIEVREIKE